MRINDFKVGDKAKIYKETEESKNPDLHISIPKLEYDRECTVIYVNDHLTVVLDENGAATSFESGEEDMKYSAVGELHFSLMYDNDCFNDRCDCSKRLFHNSEQVSRYNRYTDALCTLHEFVVHYIDYEYNVWCKSYKGDDVSLEKLEAIAEIINKDDKYINQ